MPTQAAQVIDWPGIRANAVSLGIRGAARAAAADLPPDEQVRFTERVMKRASREGWEVHREKAMASAGMSAEMSAVSAKLSNHAKPLSANVRNGAESMANTLADDSKATRLAGSRYARRTLEHAAQLDPETALEQAQNVKAVVASASTIHSWEAKQAAPSVMVNLALMGLAPQAVQAEIIEG